MSISMYCFRKVTKDDLDLIYTWANDKVTRMQSFNSEPIEYDKHVQWFNSKLEDKDTLFWIYESKQVVTSIGLVRLDRLNALPEYIKECGRDDSCMNKEYIHDECINNEYIYRINYQISPECRGQGHGAEMIGMIEDELLKVDYLKDKKIILLAEVRKDNIASVRCFEKNGYTQVNINDSTFAEKVFIKFI